VKKTLLLFIFVVLFELLFMRVLTPRFLEITNGMELLDMTTFYAPEQAFEMIENYGPEGRAYYNYIQMVDFFFPIVYSLFFTFLIAKLMMLNNLFQPRWRFLAFVPLIAGICDWLENIGIFAMLRIYPRDFRIIAVLTNMVCVLKFGFILLSIVIIIVFTMIAYQNYIPKILIRLKRKTL